MFPHPMCLCYLGLHPAVTSLQAAEHNGQTPYASFFFTLPCLLLSLEVDGLCPHPRVTGEG